MQGAWDSRLGSQAWLKFIDELIVEPDMHQGITGILKKERY